MGITKDDAKVYPSKIPMYVGTSSQVEPYTVNLESGKRMDVEIPFITDIHPMSLIFYPDIRCVCPDVTHAFIRIVEIDLKKIVDLIYRFKKDDESADYSISRLEKNLTERQVKQPSFVFPIDNTNKKCGSISLSGRDARTAIASIEELTAAGTVTSSLFAGVFSEAEMLTGNTEDTVLRTMHGNLFKHDHPDSRCSKKLMSMYDACELWRDSLNIISYLLRSSENGLSEKQLDTLNFYMETFYQISNSLFVSKAFTPYKLKLLLIPQLLRAGYIKTPWNHMTEGLEKSNHTSQKLFHSKTMRGGGNLYHQDPMFLDIHTSTFCKLVWTVQKPAADLIQDAKRTLFGETLPDENLTYLDVCQAELPMPEVCVGDERPQDLLLAGLQFLVLGYFPTPTTNQSVEDDIKSLGGKVLSKSSAEVIMRRHSTLTQCFIVLRDGKDLLQGTSTKEELLSGKKKSYQLPRLNAHQLTLRNFAGSKWIFVSVQFIDDQKKSLSVMDPMKYELKIGSNIRHRRVNDIRPLLKRQIENRAVSNQVSCIKSVRDHQLGVRGMKKKRKLHQEADSSSGSETDITDEQR